MMQLGEDGWNFEVAEAGWYGRRGIAETGGRSRRSRTSYFGAAFPFFAGSFLIPSPVFLGFFFA
jgi:hypothetical protein